MFAGAERVADRYLTVLFGPAPGGQPRLGLAVSRRVSSRAVDRNRIKRQIRESFRLNRDLLPPVDIVVIPRPPARHASRQELRQALTRLWQRVLKQCERQSLS